MSRSAVLTGRIDARDRGQLRKRLDPPATESTDPYDELWSWLRESSLKSRPTRELARLALDSFLRNTNHIEIPPDERLRQLAT